MDAYVFRLLALELKKFMQGGRVEKIHSPAPGLFSMTVYNHGLKRTLLLRHSKFVNPGSGQVQPVKGMNAAGTNAEGSGSGRRPSPALYLGAQKLPNPEKPSTLVMTLRKYLAGHRLGAASLDWSNRRVFFPLPQLAPIPKTPCPLWLCLDLINGPSLLHEKPDIQAPTWPDLLRPESAPDTKSIEVWSASLRNILADPDVWRSYPALTPALRKTLATLLERDAWEAASLLSDLQYDLERENGELRLYEFAGRPHLISAWPLPEASGMDLRELPVYAQDVEESVPEDTAVAFPALEAARQVYEPQVLAYLGASSRKQDIQATAAEKKRLTKTLLKLDLEEERLKNLTTLRADAMLLQSALWRFGQDERAEAAAFNAAETPDGQPRLLALDSRLTVRENMARLFKQSDRGLRGLEFVKKRRIELQTELEALKNGLDFQSLRKQSPHKLSGQQQKLQPTGKQSGRQKETGRSLNTAHGKTAQKSSLSKNDPAKLIQRFVSSDGFAILRGRSALGNQALLKLVQPHDLWLHVEGGPSAHVVIRREHLGQDIPERTLLEAGTLSAVKSWRKTDSKAEIIAALVKDVRPLKGGPPGTVLVDKRQAGFLVSVDHDLETRLLANASGG